MEAFRKWHSSQEITVGAADVLAARDSLAVVARISSEPPATRSANPLTKVKVGKVPDRGGRLVQHNNSFKKVIRQFIWMNFSQAY